MSALVLLLLGGTQVRASNFALATQALKIDPLIPQIIKIREWKPLGVTEICNEIGAAGGARMLLHLWLNEAVISQEWEQRLCKGRFHLGIHFHSSLRAAGRFAHGWVGKSRWDEWFCWGESWFLSRPATGIAQTLCDHGGDTTRTGPRQGSSPRAHKADLTPINHLPALLPREHRSLFINQE